MSKKFSSSTRMTFAALLLCLPIGAGCSYLDRSKDDDAPARDTGRGDAASAMPDDARVVDEGVGRLAYTARRDGRIYVYDTEDRRLLFGGHMSRSQEFILYPSENRATVDDKKVYDQDLKRQHEHRLSYLADDEGHRSDRDEDLPRGATRVESGRGPIKFRARGDGRAYVYDADAKRVILNTHVRDGQTIAVDPDKDRVTLDGKTISNANLERNDEHRIYFDKD